MGAEELFEKNQRLVYAFLNRYYPQYAYDDDARQEALLGLWQASMTFDAEKGFEFSTYAYRGMRHKIRAWLKRNMSKITTVSIDERDEKGFALVDKVAMEIDTSEEVTKSVYLDMRIERRLSEKEKRVINALRDGFSQKEIAEQENVSRQCINNRVKSARQKLTR